MKQVVSIFKVVIFGLLSCFSYGNNLKVKEITFSSEIPKGAYLKPFKCTSPTFQQLGLKGSDGYSLYPEQYIVVDEVLSMADGKVWASVEKLDRTWSLLHYNGKEWGEKFGGFECISTLVVLADGKVWMGVDNQDHTSSIVYFDGKKWITKGGFKDTTPLVISQNGEVWVGVDNQDDTSSILFYNGREWVEKIGGLNELPFLCEGVNGKVWAVVEKADERDYVLCFDGEEYIELGSFDWVNDFIAMEDGKVYLIAQNSNEKFSIMCFRNNTFEILLKDEYYVTDLSVLSSDNLWARVCKSEEVSSLFHYDGTTWTSREEKENMVVDFYPLSGGRMFAEIIQSDERISYLYFDGNAEHQEESAYKIMPLSKNQNVVLQDENRFKIYTEDSIKTYRLNLKSDESILSLSVVNTYQFLVTTNKRVLEVSLVIGENVKDISSDKSVWVDTDNKLNVDGKKCDLHVEELSRNGSVVMATVETNAEVFEPDDLGYSDKRRKLLPLDSKKIYDVASGAFRELESIDLKKARITGMSIDGMNTLGSLNVKENVRACYWNSSGKLRLLEIPDACFSIAVSGQSGYIVGEYVLDYEEGTEIKDDGYLGHPFLMSPEGVVEKFDWFKNRAFTHVNSTGDRIFGTIEGVGSACWIKLKGAWSEYLLDRDIYGISNDGKVAYGISGVWKWCGDKYVYESMLGHVPDLKKVVNTSQDSSRVYVLRKDDSLVECSLE